MHNSTPKQTITRTGRQQNMRRIERFKLCILCWMQLIVPANGQIVPINSDIRRTFDSKITVQNPFILHWHPKRGMYTKHTFVDALVKLHVKTGKSDGYVSVYMRNVVYMKEFGFAESMLDGLLNLDLGMHGLQLLRLVASCTLEAHVLQYVGMHGVGRRISAGLGCTTGVCISVTIRIYHRAWGSSDEFIKWVSWRLSAACHIHKRYTCRFSNVCSLDLSPAHHHLWHSRRHSCDVHKLCSCASMMLTFFHHSYGIYSLTHCYHSLISKERLWQLHNNLSGARTRGKTSQNPSKHRTVANPSPGRAKTSVRKIPMATWLARIEHGQRAHSHQHNIVWT